VALLHWHWLAVCLIGCGNGGEGDRVSVSVVRCLGWLVPEVNACGNKALDWVGGQRGRDKLYCSEWWSR